MLHKAAYGDYIPDKIKPMSLSRDFLLTVIYFINIIFYIANSFRGPKPLQAAFPIILLIIYALFKVSPVRK